MSLKNIKVVVGGILLLALASLAMAQDSSVVQVFKKGNKMQQFAITLQSNPSTGYQWFLQDYDSSLVNPLSVNPVEEHAHDKKVGAPSDLKWEFSANPRKFNVPRLTEVTFVYMRPFDAESASVKKVKVLLLPEQKKAAETAK